MSAAARTSAARTSAATTSAARATATSAPRARGEASGAVRRGGAAAAPPAPARNRRVAQEAAPGRRGAVRRVGAWLTALGRGLRPSTWRATLEALRARVEGPVVLAGRAALALVVAAGVFGLARAGERYVRTADAFAVRALSIEGNTRVDDGELATAAGLALGRNVLERTPEQVVAALEAHPWVAEAQAERRLPGSWVITVREHVPLAVLSIESRCDRPAPSTVAAAGTAPTAPEEPTAPEAPAVGDAPAACPGGLVLLDRDGAPFKTVDARDVVDLPVVTGLPLDRFRDEPIWRERALVAVTALLHDVETLPPAAGRSVEEVHVEEDGGLSLVLDDGLVARLGEPPHRPKLERLRRVLATLDRRGAQAAYVLLDDPRHPTRATLSMRP